MNTSANFEQIKSDFTSDPVLSTNDSVLLLPSTFTEMSISHPFMSDQTFLDAVFETPQNTPSELFRVGDENDFGYGVVYPTSPLPQASYTDFNIWMEEKLKNVEVSSDFSDFE